MLQKLKIRNQKGFTLIELMIVIAIIGILAAIAIPQFAAYRIRSYNSSAQSDARNLATSEAAFFADWQVFGKSANALAASAGGAGAPLLGPSATGTHMIIGDDPNTVARGLDIPIGSSVTLIANTNAAAAPLVANITFTGMTKHQNGNTGYGVDSDTTSVYHNPTAWAAGVAIVIADAPASTGADDFNAVGTWVAK